MRHFSVRPRYIKSPISLCYKVDQVPKSITFLQSDTLNQNFSFRIFLWL